MLIALTRKRESVAYYDEALSAIFSKHWRRLMGTCEFPDMHPLLDVLKKHGVRSDVGHYKTYVFPSIPGIDRDVHCLSKNDQKVKTFGFDGLQSVWGVIERDGRVVSACVSTRKMKSAARHGCYMSEYRHQGFAQKVVNAWARSLMIAAQVPLYSHKMDNTASAALAGKLGRNVFEEISITRG